jgi:adenosylhomocysteinase
MIKKMELAEKGEKRIEWASRRMPVLGRLRERYKEEKPLDGLKITACLHVTVETANLIDTLSAGGADISLTASNPLSTQDDVAAALAQKGLSVYAFRGEKEDEYYECIKKALDIGPDILLDDGADAITMAHKEELDIIGGCEETTTGVVRLRAMESEGRLRFPIIAVNDAETKTMFDNRYGTGQSALHGIMNATNLLFAGKTVVVAGYGWCGRGIAMRAKGLGSRVIITEMNPRKALEAVMDGFYVEKMMDAARIGDVFITATGDTSVIRREHIELMKDGAILANAGHFNIEVKILDLVELAIEVNQANEYVDEYIMKDGRRICLLAEGRLVNLACAYGHPSEVMDMSFANQALCVRYILENGGALANKVHSVPTEIDNMVAKLKLASFGIEIDELTEEQERYLHSWTT